MTSLTERYLSATLQAVPAERRDEVATELRGSIEDRIGGRTAAGQEAAAAEREVLVELGDPARLAARYTGRRLQLIGPDHYLAWARLLKVLLTIVPGTVGLLVGLLEAVDGNVGGAVGAGIATALQVAVHIAFWVTLVFALVERADAAADPPRWEVDQLPESRSGRQIGLADTAVAIGFLVLVIAYLPLQQVRSFVSTDGGENVPVLDPALWDSWLPLLLALLVATVGLEILKYRAGRWTWPLVAANAVLDVAFAGSLAWLLLTDRLFSPALLERFEWLRRDGNLDTVATVAVVATVLIVLWDVIDSVVKAARSGG